MEIEELIPQEIDDTLQPSGPRWQRHARQPMQPPRPSRRASPAGSLSSGNGTSLYTSMAATYTARMLAGEGAPFVIPVPAGEFRYFMPAIGAQDVVVGMSASGEFRARDRGLRTTARKMYSGGITHVPGSSNLETGDHLLVSAAARSRVRL